MPDLSARIEASNRLFDAVPLTTRCGGCSRPFGDHDTLDCPDTTMIGRDGGRFSVSVFNDTQPSNGTPRDHREYVRLQAAVDAYRAAIASTMAPGQESVACPEFAPNDYPFDVPNVYQCQNGLGHDGEHRYVFGDASGYAWNSGDTNSRTFVATRDVRVTNTWCYACGEYTDHREDACPSPRPECDSCGSREHRTWECEPVEDDEPYEGDDYDQMDGCDCDNCVAAAAYNGEVE